jgi:hypothetical protein
VIGILIVQTDTTRKLFVSKVGGQPATGQAALKPVGKFDSLRLYWP